MAIGQDARKAALVSRTRTPIQEPERVGSISRASRRAVLACSECKRGKKRCSETRPCENCKASQVECVYLPGSEGALRQHLKRQEELREKRAAEMRRGPTDLEEAIRELAIDESGGGYVGASSQISLGLLVSNTIQAVGVSGSGFLAPPRTVAAGPSAAAPMDRGQVPVESSVSFVEAYVKQIVPIYPILTAPEIETLRTSPPGAIYPKDDNKAPHETTALLLIFAIGARILEASGMALGLDSSPARYYEQALARLADVPSKHDLRSARILLLLAIYSLRSPGKAWTLVRMAMNFCIEIGLHRCLPPDQNRPVSALDMQKRKRVFWTCYCLDRQLSMVMGRPFSIADRDIDTDLPSDTDESTHNDEHLAQTHPGAATIPLATGDQHRLLSSFVHICRLRMIESNVQHCVYRVDHPVPFENFHQDICRLLSQLDEWKDKIPDGEGHEHCMLNYHGAVRYLVYPTLFTPATQEQTLSRRHSRACGAICQTYSSLVETNTAAVTALAVWEVFVSGLTLLYYASVGNLPAWHSATEILFNLEACSTVLYSMAKKWTGANRYSELFEKTKSSVLQSRRLAANKSLTPTLLHMLRSHGTGGDGSQGFGRWDKDADEPQPPVGNCSDAGVWSTSSVAVSTPATDDESPAPQLSRDPSTSNIQQAWQPILPIEFVASPATFGSPTESHGHSQGYGIQYAQQAALAVPVLPSQAEFLPTEANEIAMGGAPGPIGMPTMWATQHSLPYHTTTCAGYGEWPMCNDGTSSYHYPYHMDQSQVRPTPPATAIPPMIQGQGMAGPSDGQAPSEQHWQPGQFKVEDGQDQRRV